MCLNEGNKCYTASCLLHQPLMVHPFGLLPFQFVGVPRGCFHMVAWLTMRANRIIRPVAANKSLLLSDLVRVFHSALLLKLVRLCVYLAKLVCACVCTTLGYLFQERKWNPLCVFALPHGEPFLFITSPALPHAGACCNWRAKSFPKTEVLSGYYFPTDHKNYSD